MRASALAWLVLAAPAMAQDLASNRIAAQNDWSVFVEQNPTECLATSRAVEETAIRDGQPVSVQRGDAILYVTWQPAAGIAGQVIFTAGYPFAAGSMVAMVVGDRRFEMFTEGEYAWTAGPEVDAQIVAAMRAGSSAILAGVSGRGNQTQDTFSLAGFTAASDLARTSCGG